MSWFDAVPPAVVRAAMCEPPIVDNFCLPGDALALAALMHELRGPRDIAVTHAIAAALPPLPPNAPMETGRTRLRSIRAESQRQMGISVRAALWHEQLGVEALLAPPPEMRGPSDGVAAPDVEWPLSRCEAERLARLLAAASFSGCVPVLHQCFIRHERAMVSLVPQAMRTAAHSGSPEVIALLLNSTRQRRLLVSSHVPAALCIAILTEHRDVWEMFHPDHFAWSWGNAVPSLLRNHSDFFVDRYPTSRAAVAAWGEGGNRVTPLVDFSCLTLRGLRRLQHFLVPALLEPASSRAKESPDASTLPHFGVFAQWLSFFVAQCVHRQQEALLRDGVFPLYGRWITTADFSTWATEYGMQWETAIDRPMFDLLFPGRAVLGRTAPSGGLLAVELLAAARRRGDAALQAALIPLAESDPATRAAVRGSGGDPDILLQRVAEMQQAHCAALQSQEPPRNRACLDVAARLLEDDVDGARRVAVAALGASDDWRLLPLPCCGMRATVETYLRVLGECGYENFQ